MNVHMYTLKIYRRIMTTRLHRDVLGYYRRALRSIPNDHPHYDEVKRLLIEQVNDELHNRTADCRTDRRTG